MIRKLAVPVTLAAAVALAALFTAPLLETGWPSTAAHHVSANPEYTGGVAKQTLADPDYNGGVAQPLGNPEYDGG